MTELSPAAQAVWDAAWANSPVQSGDIEGTRRAQVAAALRAAADQFFTDWDATRCSVFLDAIADELKAQ